MKRNLSLTLFLLLNINLFSQIHSEQNGLKTTVINVATNGAAAKKFEIATLGFNSHHWQAGGLVIIELFCSSYQTGYQKYIIEVGYDQGAHTGDPALRLAEVHGIANAARMSFGTATNLNTEMGGYVNKSIPLYLELASYMAYTVKITYLQERVDQVSGLNHIKINENPAGTPIDDVRLDPTLNVDFTTSGNLLVKGSGNHAILNGNVGIGTLSPDSRLTVKGKIHAEEIKVDLSVPAPDYVFNDNYNLTSLEDVENYIKKNKHLPEIPSAESMKKEGISVSDMQLKLLQKVEELTLHLIKQNKIIKQQQQKLADHTKQADEIKRLEQRIEQLEAKEHPTR